MSVTIDDIRTAAWVNTACHEEGETLHQGWTCRALPRLTFARVSRSGRRVCESFFVDGRAVEDLGVAVARLNGEDAPSLLGEIREAVLAGLDEGPCS